ncbi:MAG: hypothetical protein WEB88_08365 [Gemmatimonadota bacterium]
MGLLLALGHATDVDSSAWEESFIPMQLAERVRHLTALGWFATEPESPGARA